MADYYNFDAPVDRRGTSSIKWDKYKEKDIIPLWVADMDFPSPPAVIDALIKRINHGVFGYTNTPNEINEIIIGLIENEYGWKIEKEWIVWLPGLVTGLNIVCRTVGKENDYVMTTIPIYPHFLTIPGNSGRKLIKVPLIQSDDSWKFDFQHIENSINSETRLFMLCNPHNPVGRVYEKDELSHLAKICIEHNITISSDEIHCDLLLEPGKRHIPIASISPEIADRTITLMAPSKTYNLPGLGCAFAVISNTGLRKNFIGVMNGIVPRVNILGYTAAIAAYRDSHDWHKALLDYLRGNRDLVLNCVNKMPGLSASRIEATYLAWIDTRESGIQDPVKFFENAGVGLFEGKEFGAPGFVRLNFGSRRSLLETALKRMSVAVEKHAMDIL